MTERLLFVAQRLTALLLAPMVLAHLLLILYATGRGLSAAAILERMQSSAALPAFYALFVIAAAIHAPIGLRTVLLEWTTLPRRAIDIAMLAFALLLLGLGLRAVAALWTAVA